MNTVHYYATSKTLHTAVWCCLATLARQLVAPDTCSERHSPQPRTEQVQEDRAAVLGVGVRGKVDGLVAEALQQLLAGARQLHAHALHAVAQLGADRLDNRNRAVLVQVHLPPAGQRLSIAMVCYSGSVVDTARPLYILRDLYYTKRIAGQAGGLVAQSKHQLGVSEGAHGM